MTQRFPFTVSYWIDGRDDVVTLRAGTHFRFDLGAVNRFCLNDLPARLVDLMRISSAIYVVDRMARRRAASGFTSPARAIGVRIQVLDDAFWRRSQVRDSIAETVEFLTGDFWNIEFIADTTRFTRFNRLLPDPSGSESPLIALYSGGLDSAAGLACRIAENASRPL